MKMNIRQRGVLFMMLNIRVAYLLALLSMGPWLLTPSDSFGMERYRPGSTVMVTTRFNPNGDEFPGRELKNRPSEIEWTIVPGTDGDQAVLTYFQGSGKKFCSVRFPIMDSGSPILVLNGRDEVIDKSPGHMIPLPGFPAPCRLVDLSAVTAGGFDIVKSAGGRKFRKHYRVSRQYISMADALENGWVREEHSEIQVDDAHGFLLVVVTDNNNDFLFQQLWGKDDQWWLYEETQNSKSWRH